MLTRLQRAVLFPRRFLRVPEEPSLFRAGHERWWHDGVEAWFLPADGVSATNAGPAVVFLHGNRELIDDWLPAFEPYLKLGVSLLLPEYRGYGRSGGRPTEAALRDDCTAFYDRLVARPEVDKQRVVFHGRSLGGGVACALASERSPTALVLESTFTSVADVAAGWGVPRGFITDLFDSRAVVEKSDFPLLVMHGRHDELIPHRHGEALRDASKRAELVSYDAGHNDLQAVATDYWSRLERFLVAAGVLSGSATQASR